MVRSSPVAIIRSFPFKIISDGYPEILLFAPKKYCPISVGPSTKSYTEAKLLNEVA